jgi:DNA-binding transcriptional ArsR family regulator
MPWDTPGQLGAPGQAGAPGQPGRPGLEATFQESLRRMSSYTHLMSAAAAERIGINVTDLNCLNILSLGGELTAGQLAQATGLTTASITGVVDRLEQAGYVRRERDTHDRRRVVIHMIIEPVLRDVVAVFAPMMTAWQALADGYTEDELKLIIDFQARSERVLKDNLARLREPPGPPRS